MRLPALTLVITRNRAKLSAVVLVNIATVFLVITVLSLTQYVSQSELRAWKEPLLKFSIIRPLANEISQSTLNELAQESAVGDLTPTFESLIRMPGVLATEYRLILALKEEDIPRVMERFDLKLLEGTLPKPDSRDIVLSKDIAEAKGLQIGDYVGQAIDDDEYLWGRFTVSGILDGTISMGLSSFEYYLTRGFTGHSYLIFPSNGIDMLNETIEGYGGQVRIETIRTFIERHEQEYRNFNRLIKIIGVILMSASLTILVIFLSLYLKTREREFALLYIKGVTITRLVRYVTAELIAVVVTSWLGGVISSYAAIWLIRSFLFDEGVLAASVNTESILLTLPMLALLIIISSLMVLHRTKRENLVEMIVGG